MRIGIVNGSSIGIEALRRILIMRQEYEIAWIARNGAEGVENCNRDTPDVVLMDLVMPVMGGVEATRRIMKDCPCAILIVTASVSGNTDGVFEAMGHGALDATDTPVFGRDGACVAGCETFLAKMSTIARLLGKNSGVPKPSNSGMRPADSAALPLVAIGASTGGPAALAEILAHINGDFGAAIVVVQHVDARFAAGMAEWLNSRSRLPVRLLAPGARPEIGVIRLAGTNDHLVVKPDLSFDYTPEPAKNPYRPSVDVLFQSLAAHWPAKGAAVLLTGMGRDGAEGLLALRRAGWHTIAQDEKSCVVYGMPKAASDLGAATQIAAPSDIAASLCRLYGG